MSYTSGYLQDFEIEASRSSDSLALINAMKTHYPLAGEDASLELSAKVIKGEMKWPQQ